jgi:hypothetical protein
MSHQRAEDSNLARAGYVDDVGPKVPYRGFDYVEITQEGKIKIMLRINRKAESAAAQFHPCNRSDVLSSVAVAAKNGEKGQAAPDGEGLILPAGVGDPVHLAIAVWKEGYPQGVVIR